MYRGFLIWVVSCLLSGAVFAASVEELRLWPAPDHTRLVLDLDGSTEHKVFKLSVPDRVVLDLPNGTLKYQLSKLKLPAGPIKSIRSSEERGKLRVVLDLSRPVRPKSFSLLPNKQYGHRLVIDLYDLTTVVKKETPKPPEGQKGRDVIIVIDAGHGGEDPGAVGPNRLYEKHVVMAIASKLKAKIDRVPGYRAELTRTGDYFIKLKRRSQIAREKQADLMVSIHADGFDDHRAKGASVWVLSPRGASSEVGRWLAEKENSADLIGGVGSVSLEDKDDLLAGVLLDMSMSASRSDSMKIAEILHKELSRVAPRMHKKHVEKAGFLVLKSPDIPSVLVETGFISNPHEARKLNTVSYQNAIAEALFRGIKSHFDAKPPAMTMLALNRQAENAVYFVQKGDSLSIIAERNGVSLAALRAENSLKNDVIWVGQKLRIPAS